MSEKKFQLTPDQARAVQCRKNAVVTAGAGTGKTRVLAERFCHIMQKESVGIDQILTLTFTKKATSEMQERIYQTLTSLDNAHIQSELHRFHRAHISTFDSFCRTILDTQLLAMGYPTAIIQDEMQITQGAKDCIFTFLLQGAKNPDIQLVCETLGTDVFSNQVLLPLAQHHMQPSRPIDTQAAYEEYKKHLVGLMTACVKSLAEIDEHANETEEPFNPEDPSFLEDLQQRTNYFYGPNKPSRLKKEQKAVRDVVDQLNNLVAWYQRKDITKKLFALIDSFQHMWLQEKKKKGFLSYQDTLFMTIDLLKNNPVLRATYNNKFRYIMVDEVQDNNRHQRDLLFLLAAPPEYQKTEIPSVAELRPNVLFCVGDKKQSIYRFRGAEPNLFTQLGEDLLAHGGEKILLAHNFRTEPALIDWFNKTFTPKIDHYEPIASGTQEGEGVTPKVVLIAESKATLPVDAKIGAPKHTVWEVAQYLKQMVENKVMVRTDKGFRPVEYQDMAILFRKTSKQQGFEEVLKRLEIPYFVDSARTLYLEAPVADMVYMVQLALQPYEQTFLARVLRSPYFGCDDTTVLKLLLQEQAIDALDISELETTEQEKFLLGKQLLMQIEAAIDTKSHAAVFRMLWYYGGYRYWLLQQKKTHTYLEHYYYIQKLAQGADSRGLTMYQFVQELTEHFGSAKKVDEKLLLPVQQGVSLMTIHKSKGLEFPVVVIPEMHDYGKSKAVSPCMVSDTYGITITPGRLRELGNPFATALKPHEQRLEQEEMLRLFYVAVTRAKSHIILSGLLPKNVSESMFFSCIDTHELNWKSFAEAQDIQEVHPMKELTWETYRNAGTSTRITPKTMQQLYAQGAVLKAMAQDLTVVDLNGLVAHTSGASKSTKSSKDTELPPLWIDSIVRDSSFYAKFGTLCHKIIELHITNKPVPQYPCDQEYWQEFDPEKEWPSIMADAHKLVTGYLAKGALEETALAEESIMISYAKLMTDSESFTPPCSTQELHDMIIKQFGQPPEYIVGQIDLVVETADRVRIIDFKTNRYKVSGQYDMQMALYAYAAKEIWKKPVEIDLVYLREFL